MWPHRAQEACSGSTRWPSSQGQLLEPCCGEGPARCGEGLPHTLGLTPLHPQHYCPECRTGRWDRMQVRKLVSTPKSDPSPLTCTTQPPAIPHGRMGAIPRLLGTVRTDSGVGRGSGRVCMRWESGVGDIHRIEVLHTTFC